MRDRRAVTQQSHRRTFPDISIAHLFQQAQHSPSVLVLPPSGFFAHRQYAIGSLPRDRLTNVCVEFSLERLVWIVLHLSFPFLIVESFAAAHMML